MTTDRGELLHGTLEMLILRCLTEGPMHGFAITERASPSASRHWQEDWA